METQHRLKAWLETQIADATDVRISGFEQVTFRHSADIMLLTINWSDGTRSHSQDAVIRVRPPTPGLLEPYDLKRQFDVLRALESTPVRAPRPLWYEPTGEVLGRDFYVMERLTGTVYEHTVGLADLLEASRSIDRLRFKAVNLTKKFNLIIAKNTQIGCDRSLVSIACRHRADGRPFG
jgi:aminoglycoside phosphotransferase (APT) family kinase protein